MFSINTCLELDLLEILGKNSYYRLFVCCFINGPLPYTLKFTFLYSSSVLSVQNGNNSFKRQLCTFESSAPERRLTAEKNFDSTMEHINFQKVVLKRVNYKAAHSMGDGS